MPAGAHGAAARQAAAARQPVGSPLQLSKVHWVRPEVVVEVTYLTWTEITRYGRSPISEQREDKPARQVARPVPRSRE